MPKTDQLKCSGVGRDKDCAKALQFYFNRPVTDDEMRFLHEVMQRAVASAPKFQDGRRFGHTRLVYNKATRSIDRVPTVAKENLNDGTE